MNVMVVIPYITEVTTLLFSLVEIILSVNEVSSWKFTKKRRLLYIKANMDTVNTCFICC
jgi:hypothetical protein